jgi:hypothetical protein
MIDGSYFLYEPGKGMMIYNRYGREPTTMLGNLTHETWIFTWQDNSTTVTNNQHQEVIPGIWWPIKGEYVTDGTALLSINLRK